MNPFLQLNTYAQRYNHPTPEHLALLQRASDRRFLSRDYIGDRAFAIWLRTKELTPNHKISLRNNVDGWGRDIRGLYEDGYWKFTFPADEYMKGMSYRFVLDDEHRMIGPDLAHPGAFSQIISEEHVIFPDVPKPAAALQAAPPALADTAFEIWFRTARYADRLITLRNKIDNNWQTEIKGRYEDGYWKFSFPPHPRYQNKDEFAYKFLLDGSEWMQMSQEYKDARHDKRDEVNLKYDGPSILIHPEGSIRFPQPSKRFRHPFDCLMVEESMKQQSYIRNHYGDEVPFKVIVIGSGMGGGILADALTNQGINTLVLEAGSLTHESHTYNLPTGDAGPEGARYRVGSYRNVEPAKTGFSEKITVNFGGRSIFWSGIIPRMQPYELKYWPDPVRDHFNSDQGYPAAEKLMRKFVSFGQFEDDLVEAAQAAFPDWDVQHLPRADHQPERRPKGTPPPKSLVARSTGVFSTADLLLDSLSTADGPGGAEHLYINANHLVTKLEHENGYVTGVICEDLIGLQTRKFVADFYVLAAGSMESVRIALNSGLQEQHPFIGRGFTDHPGFYLGYDWGNRIEIPKGSKWHGHDQQARIFFYPKEDSAQPLRFNVEINLNGHFWTERHSDNVIQDHRIATSAGEKDGPRTLVNIKFSFANELMEENFIQHGPEKQNGKLDVKVDFMKEQPHWRPAVIKLARTILEFFDVDPDLADSMLAGTNGFGGGGSPHHAGGSMRMGRDGKERVVDTNLKFDKMLNLYVCDPSVFPVIPAANPSLTLAVLAQRLANHLAVTEPPRPPLSGATPQSAGESKIKVVSEGKAARSKKALHPA